MEVLDNIRRIRKLKGLSQEYVAGKLHIHVINYGKIERGETALTVERLYQISEIIESSVLELLGENNKLIAENIELKAENESLKIANIFTEEDKRRMEQANLQWDEYKMNLLFVNTLKYLDYIDVDAFKNAYGKYFPQSKKIPYVLIKEFERFFYSVGNKYASSEMRKFIDIDKFENSDLIIEESKFSGRSINKIISELKTLQNKQ